FTVKISEEELYDLVQRKAASLTLTDEAVAERLKTQRQQREADKQPPRPSRPADRLRTLDPGKASMDRVKANLSTVRGPCRGASSPQTPGRGGGQQGFPQQKRQDRPMPMPTITDERTTPSSHETTDIAFAAYLLTRGYAITGLSGPVGRTCFCFDKPIPPELF